MDLINTLPYAFLRSRVWLMKRKKDKQNRFDVYNCNPHVTVPTQNGLLPAPSDWKLSTPNCSRNENILLAGSNTWGTGLCLKIKWRPNEHLKLYTMLTSFTLECGKDKPIYDYQEVWTQSLNHHHLDDQQQHQSYIRRYSGQNFTLDVLVPYRRYRLSFSGYMRNRQDNKLVYVRFRSIVSANGKIFDFKEQYDSKFIALQLVKKRSKGSYLDILNQLVLHDRHEQSVQFRCVYSFAISNESSSQEEHKLFCWGFHARQFVSTDTLANIRFKRVLAYFSSGATFHLASIERYPDNKQDERLQLDIGYACPQCQITSPIQQLDTVDWDQVSLNTRDKLQFKFKCDNIQVEVKSLPEPVNAESDFIDLVSTSGKKGRALILIDHIADDMQDQLVVNNSVSSYVSSIQDNRQIIDLAYLEMECATRQLDKERPLVVSLDQDNCQYSSLCGSKAASLAQLRHYSQTNLTNLCKFEVPNGVVLTRYAWDLILEQNPSIKQAERQLIEAVNSANKEDMRHQSEQIRNIFTPSGGDSKVTIPHQLIEELEKSMLDTFNIDNLSKSSKPFAVRSSSWGEDDDDMSAAGQLTTLLSVKGLEQLCKAILICFASKYSLTNLEYKHQHGLPVDMPMAIVIQEMIECDKAGVMFTCDPTSGDDRQIVITANYGLGESVVSAATDPDTILVGVDIDQQEPNNLSKRRFDKINQMIVGNKKIIMTSESISAKQLQEYGMLPSIDVDEKDNNGGAEQQLEQQYDLSKCCLSEEEIIRLSNCGLELVKYFRCARDIEWGFKEGQLFMFQSRPITGLDTMNEFELLHEFSVGLSGEMEWLSRANVGEVMPLAMSPLTLTYSIHFWGITYNHQLMSDGIVRRDQWYNYKSSDIAFVGYFNFFNLRMSKMFAFGAGKHRPLAARAMEIGIFGHEVEEAGLVEACSEMSRPMSWYVPFKYLYSSLPYRLKPQKVVAKVRKEVKNLRQNILDYKFVNKKSSIPDLFQQMNLILPYLIDGLNGHLMATMMSPEYNQRLVTLLSKSIDDPMKLFACYSKLLSSHSDVFSARVPKMVKKMSEVIASKGPEELKMFLAMNDADSFKYITTKKDESELKDLFEKFIDNFGHRSYNEFDLSTPRWREEPGIVVAMVKQSCQSQLVELEASDKEKTPETDTKQEAKELLKDLNSQFSFSDKIKMNRFILPKCHQLVDIRERTKDLVIYLMDCLRCAASCLAREMCNQGRLPDADLIFFLTFDEVRRLSENTEPALVMHAQRRRRFVKKIDSWKFDEILKGYDFLPRHLTIDSEEAIKLKDRLKNLPKIFGTPASSGQVEGRVCIVSSYKQLDRVKSGDILVTYSTDISFSPVFPILAGIITEIGGMISHGAVIAREYGIPTLIGVTNACSIFEDGERVVLDANHGHILRLDIPAQED